ncbi:MAG: DUF4003 domain-containing protein [Clostridiales bacterium]|jgi:hypothetical protein|nr:DUF4003 domain-containing protein [Clostridiales bacterium]
MTSKTEEKLILFVTNAQTIKNEFTWQHALTRRLAALLYAQENKTVDCEAIRRCHTMIKGSVGAFSAFRGNMSLSIASLLSLSDNPEHLLREAIKVYDLLKSAKLHASDYLAIAAYQIAAGAGSDNYSAVIERTRAFYNGMKAHHRFYTGQDDYVFAAMLGLSDLDVGIGVERIEQLYTRLKDEFWGKNSVQALAQVMVLGGMSDTTTGRVLSLRDTLRAQKMRFDRSYTLSSLGILALLPVDIEIIVRDIDEAQAFLRMQKGFGSPSVDKQELLLLAAAIVSREYADSAKSGVLTATLSTSITTNIIIAQQAAMIAIITASNAAARASASSY